MKTRGGIYRMSQSHSIITDHIQSYCDGGIAFLSCELGYWGTCPSKKGLATPLAASISLHWINNLMQCITSKMFFVVLLYKLGKFKIQWLNLNLFLLGLLFLFKFLWKSLTVISWCSFWLYPPAYWKYFAKNIFKCSLKLDCNCWSIKAMLLIFTVKLKALSVI